MRTAGFALYTLARLGAVTAHQRWVSPPMRPNVFDRHMRAWCRRLLTMFGVTVIVDPSPPLPATGARLVVANHRSPGDIVVLLSLFGGQFLGRSDVKRWPIIGTAAEKAGTVWVDRARGTSGAAAIRVIKKRLEQGATMLVFPEGTTFSGDEVRPFRLGALSAVKGLDVEIIPVGLAYDAGSEWVDETFPSHLRKMAGRKATRLVVKVGTAIRFDPAQDTSSVSSRLRETVQQLVTEAREIHVRAR